MAFIETYSRTRLLWFKVIMKIRRILTSKSDKFEKTNLENNVLQKPNIDEKKSTYS